MRYQGPEQRSQSVPSPAHSDATWGLHRIELMIPVKARDREAPGHASRIYVRHRAGMYACRRERRSKSTRSFSRERSVRRATLGRAGGASLPLPGRWARAALLVPVDTDYDEFEAAIHESFDVVAPPVDLRPGARTAARPCTSPWDVAPHALSDVLIAETALHHGLGIIHTDRDYDRLAEVRALKVRRVQCRPLDPGRLPTSGGGHAWAAHVGRPRIEHLVGR